MKKKWLAAALAGILLAGAVLSGCAATEKAKRLRFGVAGEGGIYREFGERFAALENETDNGQVELKATAGSAANLRLLTGEYLQLAIAQADLVQDAYDQTGIFADEEESRGFGAVAALYTETCQVVVRADSDIRSIEDLHGRTVSIGAEESGSEQNARQILSAYGLNDKMVSMVNLNYEDAAAQLKAGRVDAIFMTVGAMKNVPIEVEEAARIDGCSSFRMFWTIVFPLIRPAVITFVIINTFWFWNDYLLTQMMLSQGAAHHPAGHAGNVQRCILRMGYGACRLDPFHHPAADLLYHLAAQHH